MTEEHEISRRQRRVSVGRRAFDPAQIVAGILGLILVIVGGVAIARVGFDSFTEETTTVGGFDMTLLMAVINLVVGLLFLGVAARTFDVRGSLIALGTLALAFGAIAAIEPDPFVTYLGEGRDLGIAYLLIGVVSLIAGLTTRTVVTTERSVVDDDLTIE